jgi:hypothetical protein
MKSKLILLIGLVLGLVQVLAAFEPKSMKDCRLAFLLGLGWGNSTIVFGSVEHDRTFEDVARAYAKDIGASDTELNSAVWRTIVRSALSACYDPRKRIAMQMNDCLSEGFGPDVWQQRVDVVSAYAAGAYARHGTDTGFRMTNQAKGTYLVLVVQRLAEVSIHLAINPGLPGNLTVTLSGGGKDELANFFAEMKIIREVIQAAK